MATSTPRREILGFADGHLAAGAWVGRPLIRGDAYFGLREVVRVATERRAAAVLSGGDLTDAVNSPSEPIDVLMQCLSELRDAQVRFLYVQGNHDPCDPPWPSLHEWAEHIDQKLVKVGDVWVYGLDYREPVALAEALQTVPDRANILLAHQAWEECKAAQATPQGSVKTIPGKGRLVVFTGDLHRHLSRKVTAHGGRKITVVSPGSLCLQSVDEEADKVVVSFNPDDFSFEAIPIRSRQIVTTDFLGGQIEAEEALDNLPAQLRKAIERAEQLGLPEEIKKPIAVVQLSRGTAGMKSRFRRAVGDLAHFVDTVRTKSLSEANDLDEAESSVVASAEDAEALRASSAEWLAAALGKKIDREREPEAYDLAFRLLTNGAEGRSIVRDWIRRREDERVGQAG